MSYGYLPCKLSEIHATLQTLFNSDSDGKAKRAVGGKNLIFLAADEQAAESFEPVIESVCAVCPSRVFLVFASQKSDVESSVNARCHETSGPELICSEVVRLSYPPALLQSVISVLRGSFLTGVSTDLLVLDSRVDTETVAAFVPLIERLIFDSSSYRGEPNTWFMFLHQRALPVDLTWVRLSPWREELRNTFQYHGALEFLSDIETIDLHYSGADIPPAALMHAGWLLSRLQYAPSTYGVSGWECFNPRGQRLLVRMECDSNTAHDLISMRIGFRVPGSAMGGEGAYVEMRRNGALEVRMQLGRSIRTVRTLDEESLVSLLEQLYLSFTPSPVHLSSAQIARDLYELRKGYQVR